MTFGQAFKGPEIWVLPRSPVCSRGAGASERDVIILPRQRNLWVTDTSNGAGKVRSRRPANPLLVGRRCASAQVGAVPGAFLPGYRWMTCRGLLKSVAAC